MPYVFDTSVWIQIARTHPPDIYRRFWAQLDAAIDGGDVRSPHEVIEEVARGIDGFDRTLRQRAALFVALDQQLQMAVEEVMTRCPGLYDGVGERDRGDPFVVAVGHLLGGTVVTRERPRRAPTSPMKIPDACNQMGVRCLDWFDFLREIRWDL